MSGRIRALEPDFVDTFPQPMEPKVLYVAIGYRMCGHLCCCGCGEEVITPLSPAQWSFTYDGYSVSLSPSIGSWSLTCQSHYWIRKGQVHWSRAYAPAEIQGARADDRAELEAEASEGARTSWSRFRRWLRL